MESPSRILCIHTDGGMGDLLLSSVVAEDLHRCFPGCHVCFLAAPRFAPLFENHPWVDSVLELAPSASLPEKVKRLRAEAFDTALLLWTTSRHAWSVLLAGIPTRIGQGGRLTYSFSFTHPIRVRSAHGDTTSHWTDTQLDFVRPLGCQPAGDASPIVITTAEEKNKAAELLQRVGSTGIRPLCGLHLCKGLAVDENRWPVDRFVDIGAGMIREGFDVLLTGTASEHALVETVRQKISALTNEGLVNNLAGTCSLRETAALLERLNVFICPDTGTGHLAAALGVPVVSIFPLRSDVPARWRPTGVPYRIVRPTAWDCGESCVKEKCTRFTCLLHIDPAEVMAAAVKIAK